MVSLLPELERVLFDVGYRSLLLSVIGRDRELAGNSPLEFVRSSSQAVGPALGGALMALIGTTSLVLVQSTTFGRPHSACSAYRLGRRLLSPLWTGTGCAGGSQKGSDSCAGHRCCGRAR